MKQVFVWGSFAVLLCACSGNQEAKEPIEVSPQNTATTAAPDYNGAAAFAETKYADIGRTATEALASGDLEGWMKVYADNAVYSWNNGDSIAGKPAITAYWKKRRTEIIDSIRFSDHIFLPIRVNRPQSIEEPGVWLLSWYRVDVKYKSGNRMTQWIHTDMHFNANDQVDRVIQYLDRSVISKAEK